MNLHAPRANLFDDNGRLIIAHFGGSTWQATDGSTVVGKAEASSTVDASAVPWLRLAATSTAAGPRRLPALADHVHPTDRNHRWLAPAAAECNAARAGTVTEIPYTADYYFWQQTNA